MQFELDHAIILLSRTPATLRSMLEDLPPAWVFATEGEQTWSPFDVVGHLIHADRTNWLPRARMILEFGDARDFEPFDRFAQFELNRGKTLAELLDTFRDRRAECLATLRAMNLKREDLAKAGKHPELGGVTLEQLLATWVVHDLTHIAQITRAMAKQYKEAVGPWKAYLSVLR